MTEYKKKLIEVALPLEAINREAVRENYIYRGNPSAIHKWWAQRPFAIARTILFASLVDDPSAHPDRFPTVAAQDEERSRLFGLLERLARWESTQDDALMTEARRCVAADCDPLPAVLDPFAGGATIPLEAQRLGLETHASDLNPVAALINRALLEFPKQFRGRPPVHPSARSKIGHDGSWDGVQGLMEDIRLYGGWLRERAELKLHDLYPSERLSDGTDAPVLAWLWATTVTCPNPACGAETPLVRSFAVSTKRGGETWMEPLVDRDSKTYRFEVRRGRCPIPGTVSQRGGRCIVCESPIPLAHVRQEGVSGRLGSRLMATMVETPSGRSYVAPSSHQEAAAARARPPEDLLDVDLPSNPRAITTSNYGMTRHRDLYTPRQLEMLGVLSDLVPQGVEQVVRDSQDTEYGRTVGTYLAFVVDKVAQFNSRLVLWYAKENRQTHTFGRQALSMTWDYAEGNPFAGIGGGIDVAIRTVADALAGSAPSGATAYVRNLDAAHLTPTTSVPVLVCTDPPYYDNVPYADLSDFFYVWLRRSAGNLHPDFFGTLLAPKRQELIAEPARFDGDRLQAREFFESGMREVFSRMRSIASEEYPTTVYYAFKQAEVSDAGAAVSSGWETMLTGLVESGFAVTGTWPTRTERTGRMRDTGSNALASSIVLVCRPRSSEAPLATRREFMAALREELPAALHSLQKGNIAPVDLAQAAIGPGMAVYSRFGRVVETDGTSMTVRAALGLINQALDEQLAEQEGEFESSTRWAISWFEEVGMSVGEFGLAETLCKAKNCSVEGMVRDGILEARGGKVRLLRREELDPDWNPLTDRRLTVWEMTQHLIRRLDGGEAAAAALVRQLGANAEVARDLAYRLYAICERKKRPQEAQDYNGLVVAWPSLVQLAAGEPASAGPSQTSFEV